MRCPLPDCGHPNSRVVDVRQKKHMRRRYRRRECAKCHERFSTYERYAGEDASWNMAINEAIAKLRSMRERERTPRRTKRPLLPRKFLQ